MDVKKADWIDPVISSEDELLGKSEYNKTKVLMDLMLKLNLESFYYS
ncbi:hypothetical protein [Lactococcus hircilactis]